MKKVKKLTIATIITIGLLSAVLLSGCEDLNFNTTGSGDRTQTTQDTQAPQTQHTQQSDPQKTDGETPSEPVAAPLVVLPELLIPTASGIAVEKNGQAVVDFSNMQDGYIMAKYTEATDLKIKLLITVPDGVQYTYSLRPNRDFEVFPLSGGDGNYEIGVFKQVEGTRYSMVLSTSINVTLTDEFAPFLRPNQYVDFSLDSAAVRKAAELTAGITEFMDKVGAIYNFVISNIVYDVQLAETVQSDYLPDIDRILASGKGICFDYASLMAAMLRSQGIPTKLVIGYTGDVYHAWISVYCKEDGWLDDIIFFDGHTWRLVDPTFAANGTSQSVSQYIGDGANYTVKYLH